jgi:hypothetical protein
MAIGKTCRQHSNHMQRIPQGHRPCGETAAPVIACAARHALRVGWRSLRAPKPESTRRDINPMELGLAQRCTGLHVRSGVPTEPLSRRREINPMEHLARGDCTVPGGCGSEPDRTTLIEAAPPMGSHAPPASPSGLAAAIGGVGQTDPMNPERRRCDGFGSAGRGRRSRWRRGRSVCVHLRSFAVPFSCLLACGSMPGPGARGAICGRADADSMQLESAYGAAARGCSSRRRGASTLTLAASRLDLGPLFAAQAREERAR